MNRSKAKPHISAVPVCYPFDHQNNINPENHNAIICLCGSEGCLVVWFAL